MMVTPGLNLRWFFQFTEFLMALQKKGSTGVAKDLDAVMHQRMGFYVSKKNVLLVLVFTQSVLMQKMIRTMAMALAVQ